MFNVPLLCVRYCVGCWDNNTGTLWPFSASDEFYLKLVLLCPLSSDMYVSIDLVEEIIERQLKRYKNKLVDQKQNAMSLSKAFLDEEVEDDDEIKVIRTKRFAVKPMDVEEACIQMELLGHSFFVFRNAETDEVNVVYKRKGNTYGLIEPEY